jgi:hypothetical protein
MTTRILASGSTPTPPPIAALTAIYAVLREVQTSVIPPPVKAMLAFFLMDSWTDSTVQSAALRQALSLDPPGEQVTGNIRVGSVT